MSPPYATSQSRRDDLMKQTGNLFLGLKSPCCPCDSLQFIFSPKHKEGESAW